MMKTFSITSLDINTTSKVLFIYPHPDDEAYCNAGLIQKIIRLGAQPYLLCLTKGEASTLKFSLKSNESLSDAREKEFYAVMKFLGVSNFNIGDFPDGKLTSQENAVYEYINKIIETFKPSILVTYEPSGIYGHPDHILVSTIVTQLSKEKSIKLVYSTVNNDYKSAKSSLKMASNISSVNPVKPKLQLKLTPGEFIKKINCLKLYKSQISFKQELLHKLYQAIKLQSEYYFF